MREYWNLLKNGQLNKEQLSSLSEYPKDFGPIEIHITDLERYGNISDNSGFYEITEKGRDYLVFLKALFGEERGLCKGF